MLKHTMRVLLGLVLFLSFAAIVSPPVHAIASVKPHAVVIPCTEPDATCENQDPITSGCADLTVGKAQMANAGAIAVGPASNPVVIARVYNWYSGTCGTNWTQAEVTSAYPSLKIRIDIYRDNSQPVYCYPDDCHSFTTLNSGVQTWTNMALASQVFAYAEIVVLSPTDNLYHSATVAA